MILQKNGTDPNMLHQTSIGKTKSHYTPAMENGIAMLSFVPRDDKQRVYDNSAYEADRINHTQLENSEFPPPPPYWQNDNDDVYPRVDEEMRTAV